MTLKGALASIVGALDAADVPYMLTGSVASSIHVGPRATQDIDLVVDPTPEQLSRFMSLLPPEQYMAHLDSALEALRTRRQFNVLELASGWKFDLILKKQRRFSREEFERRVVVDLDGLRVMVATPEDVLLSKLEWASMGGSRRQLEDVAALLRVRSATLDMAYVGHWVRELALEDEWATARATIEEA